MWEMGSKTKHESVITPHASIVTLGPQFRIMKTIDRKVDTTNSCTKYTMSRKLLAR